MRLALALLVFSSSTAAIAGATPAIEVQDDGTIVAQMHFDYTPEEIRTAIPRMQNQGAKPSSVLAVKMWRDGGCHGIFRQTRGLFSPLELNTRLCPTDTGWREVLVESEDYSAYDVEWVVASEAEGSQLQMRVRSSVNIPVTTAMVRQGTIASMNETFALLLKRLVGRRDAKQ